MKLDVIIPVYHPDEKLHRLLHGIEQQTCQPEHLFLLHTVAKGTSTNLDWAIPESLQKQAKVIRIEKSTFDHGGTRDMGIQLSDADVILLMTQDAVPLHGNLLESLVKTLEQDEHIAVAYGRQISDRKSNVPERYTRTFNYPAESVVKSKADLPKLGIKTYFCSNVCAAYRRKIYQKLGGFEKHIIFNEDMVFAARAIQQGYYVAYDAEAVVRHSHDYTCKQLVRRNFDMGVSQACYPEIFQSVKSEREGIRMVLKILDELAGRKEFLQMWKFITESSCKYVGYQLGKHYKWLPRRMVMRLTMNETYWKERKE